MDKDRTVDVKEKIYIRKRLIKAFLESIPFYLCRIIPINKKKIVFCCIEGTTGYSCNPKYIAEELIRRNIEGTTDYKLIWLVNDINKKFPSQIEVVRNTLWNRAYELATAAIWIDNSRKQLEVRKRKKQTYIQTWHAKLGFKPTCLDRGASFSRIAYLVSKHDSEMVDYWLSNSDWYDRTLPTGSLYEGKILRCASPRCDILVYGKNSASVKVREMYHMPENAQIIMYAPTFRGGSQGIDRKLENGEEYAPDYETLICALEKKFGGKWYVFLRLHPQLSAQNIQSKKYAERLIDVSKVDDMYELLAGCNGFLTDYSSAAFDAAVMNIPIFLYAADYKKYEKERGSLLWDLRKIPFLLAENDEELVKKIEQFNEIKYKEALSEIFQKTVMIEDGTGSSRVVDFITDQKP